MSAANMCSNFSQLGLNLGKLKINHSVAVLYDLIQPTIFTTCKKKIVRTVHRKLRDNDFMFDKILHKLG
ncbi:Uncharacterised protein [Sphingobacterium thalpophilum]|uniref:Uncharacterized protein n=2 Tax=Bacteroidota TaxID=976 RepID=A0A4U9VSJ9_9SPHI|nr:Uncharacterised protein [Sphingobacterium thalpophilum]